MKGGKLPNLALLCFLLIFTDPFASLQVDETTQAINSSMCKSNCSHLPPPESAWPFGLSIALSNLAGIVCCITVVKNCIVLFTFKKDGLLRLPQNYLFASLTVADLLTALVSMPLLTQYVLLERWVLSQAVCDVWMALDWTLRLASLYLRALITLDKFFSAKYPTWYVVWRTAPKVKTTICGVWLLPAVTIVAYIFGSKRESRVSDTETCEMPFMRNKDTAFYISVVYFWIPVVTVGSLYVSLYATSYATYKRYERLRKSWNLCNKDQHKTSKGWKRQKGSTKECKPLSDFNTTEILNPEHLDIIKPRTKDLGNGDIVPSEYVNIENYSREPTIKVNRDLPPYCSPIIKVTSPVESEPKGKTTIFEEDFISSDEEFMKTLYRSNARCPADAVQDSQESTGTFLFERKNRSKDKKAKPCKLKTLSGSSDSDEEVIQAPINNTPEPEAIRPRTNPKKDFTKLQDSSKIIETTYNESPSQRQRDTVVSSIAGRNFNNQDKQTMACNLLHIRSDSKSCDEVSNAMGQGYKRPEPWGPPGKRHWIEEKLSLSVDDETNNTVPRGDHDRKIVKEIVASAQEINDKIRCGRTSMGNQLCLSLSPNKLSSTMNMVHTKPACYDKNDRTADDVSSQHLEDNKCNADAKRLNDIMQENRLMTGILLTLPEKYCDKDHKIDKISETIEEGDQNGLDPNLLSESQTLTFDIKSKAIMSENDKSKEAALMHQPKFEKKLCVLNTGFNLITKQSEHSGQITHATTVVPGSQYTEIKNKSNQTCSNIPGDDRISLKTKTFFQQLQNTMRSSIEALSLSSAYFDSLHRALNVLPEDASFNTVPTRIDNINPRRCSIITEPQFQLTTSTCRHPVSNISENSRARCDSRDLIIHTGTTNGEPHIRSRAPGKSRYKNELCIDSGNFQTTNFCFEAVSGNQKHCVNLKPSTKSKHSKKDTKKPPPSILKSRDSHSRKNRCECGSKLNPPQAGGMRKLGQTVQINNIETEPNCKAENKVSRSRPTTDQKPVKSVYLDKISWASYLSQRSQTPDNKIKWDKSSSEEENMFSAGVNPRHTETSREETGMHLVTFEKTTAAVNETCTQLKSTEHIKEKVDEVQSSTLAERPNMLPDVTLVQVVPPEADRRRDLDRHPIFLYGVGNRCNGQIQLDTQSMKTAFQEISAISSLLCVFLICWLPLHVLIFADAFLLGTIEALWYQMTTWLIYINSLLNPFCYNYIHTGFLVLWQHLVRSCKT